MDSQSEYEMPFADAWNALVNGASIISEMSPELVWRLVDGRPQCGWYSTLQSIVGKWMPAAETAQTVPIPYTLAGWRIIEDPPPVVVTARTCFNVPLSLNDVQCVLRVMDCALGVDEYDELKDRLRQCESDIIAGIASSSGLCISRGEHRLSLLLSEPLQAPVS